MRTNVSSVLVLPDDPCLSQPVAVSIRTQDGNLMRHRLKKLLKDDQVVFVDKRLVDELIADLDCLIANVYQPWVIELMELKCRDDLALIETMRMMLKDKDPEQRYNTVQYAKICFACREMWLKAKDEVLRMEVVRQYESCWIQHERLKREHEMLEHAFSKLQESNSALYKDYYKLCDEHKALVNVIANEN